jgi:hypothetical protein
MIHTSRVDEYHLDDFGRICPTYQMGWVHKEWQDAATFDEALQGIAANSLAEVFPTQDQRLGPEDLGGLKAQRYLDIADGFYLATAIDARFAVYRFLWKGNMYFTMRPDFPMRLLVKNLDEAPINAFESEVRDLLIDYNRELDALQYACLKGEIELTEIYPMDWWVEFWTVRGISVLPQADDPARKAPASHKPSGTTEIDELTTVIGRAHVSDKLAKMNQAAAKYWGNADRNDRGTHPTNTTVAAWLIQQGFSPTLADKAATIIRPEWAPTGRKPEE